MFSFKEISILSDIHNKWTSMDNWTQTEHYTVLSWWSKWKWLFLRASAWYVDHGWAKLHSELHSWLHSEWPKGWPGDNNHHYGLIWPGRLCSHARDNRNSKLEISKTLQFQNYESLTTTWVRMATKQWVFELYNKCNCCNRKYQHTKRCGVTHTHN